MKTCSKCGETKPLEAFYAQATCRGGRRPYCKECDRARVAAKRTSQIDSYRARERERQAQLTAEYKAERARKHYARNRKKVIDYQLWRYAMKRASSGEVVERDAILRRDGGRCRECDTDLTVLTVWHLDHIVPLALGGTHDWSNLQALCRPCNSRKGARLEGQIALPV